MYPEEKMEVVKLPDDKDGIHFGLFDHNKLITVASWFRGNANAAQLRKLATLEKFRNTGYGTLLMHYIIEFSKSEQIEILWCNARRTALDFYKRLDFTETQTTFHKNGLDYIILQLDLIKSPN